MLRRLWPFALIAAGILVICMGLTYDVLFAGIPYQDPPPELVARYNFHTRVASGICCLGVVPSLAGGVMLMIRLVRRLGR